MSDIDTEAVDSLKVLAPNRPIREAVDSLKVLAPNRPIREAVDSLKVLAPNRPIREADLKWTLRHFAFGPTADLDECILREQFGY